MHKEIEVLTGDYDRSRHAFKQIRGIPHPSHLPVGVNRKGKDADLAGLNEWLFWRGIPDYRVGLDQLKERLDIRNEKDLLEEEYALSVSDNYWLKPADKKVSWGKVNFFSRSYDYEGFARASFRKTAFEAQESAKHTPNNTLCGYHRKAWIPKPDGLYLYKGSTGYCQQECINEWIASIMGERLGLYCIPYEVEVYEQQLVSVCPTFLDPYTDLVTANDVIRTLGADTERSYEHYLEAMEAYGLTDAAHYLDEVMVLDYLMMNTDRHGQNYGILVDADTNEWLQPAPIFDTGTGLGCFVRTSDLAELEDHRTCKFFNERHLSHEALLERVTDLSRFDFSALDGVPELLFNKMIKYRDLTAMTQERAEAVTALLERRIERVKHAAMRVR